MDTADFTGARQEMVQQQIEGRGVRSPRVLEAMRAVPREAFLPASLRSAAYRDAPLPIDEGQTISQPYIVALMIDALALRGGEKVLEIGTGSGYAAAVLSRICKDVYTVERIGQLAEKAAAAIAQLGYRNVHVLHADGTLGWAEHAPYDAIVVAAGGPEVPESLKAQLKVGGRLVIPVGADRLVQELVRVTRLSSSRYQSEDIADVRFVPLLGAEGWAPQEVALKSVPAGTSLPRQLAAACTGFKSIHEFDLEPLMRRIDNARIVLIGEASHGTSEFYRMREQLSRALIGRMGFSFIAIEGDWPDAARIDHYVRHARYAPSEWTAFARFPTWMWRNREVRGFVDWLREHNAGLEPDRRAAFHGLDLYSLHNSIRAILDYLDKVDPPTAQIARHRYACLSPFQTDPAAYGEAALTGQYQTCEREVLSMLADLMKKRMAYAEHDGERFLDAVQNARLVANAERYYRTMYYGSRSSWNLRDSHMFETLKALLAFHGETSRGIVWAHNSHIGDAAATEMSLRGEYNLGHLCRQEFGRGAYLIGFGTHCGTVAAASDWDAPMEIKTVLPSLDGSYERMFHDAGHEQCLLTLRNQAADSLIERLLVPRLERAIGVIYRPETELQSHYFRAVLPRQFDEYFWFDKTRAVAPLHTEELKGVPDTYPFGL